MKITIKERDIELKYSFRALMVFENITGQSFNPTTFSDIVYLFYSIVVACTYRDSEQITFDDFMDYLDDNNHVLTEFTVWLGNVFASMEAMTSKADKEDAKKIKAPKKSKN